jgi:hypothetical protein
MVIRLEPEIFGTVQPEAATLTVAVQMPENRTAHVNVFVSNNETAQDRVRLALRPAGEPVSLTQYILYDTLIVTSHSVIISNVCVNEGDQILVYSEAGATAFNITGVAFVNNAVQA